MNKPVVKAAMMYNGSSQANETKNDVTENPTIASGKNPVAANRKRSVSVPFRHARGSRRRRASGEMIRPATNPTQRTRPGTPSSDPACTYELCGAVQRIGPVLLRFTSFGEMVHSARWK